jgi:MurNAc alpha-1-phosphate uridylyltransferase
MSAPRAAMVMAAGLGTRMRPLTATCPKALLRVAGRALVDHAIDHARAAGLSPIVVNLHHLADQMRAHLAGRDVLLSDETSLLLETGGGVRQALPMLGPAPFAVINSDAIFAGPPPLETLRAAWDDARMDALLLLVPRGAARAYTRAGDFTLGADGRPARRGDATEAPFVYSGAQIIRPEAFAGTPDGAFSTNLVWDRLLDTGRLFAVIHRGGWVDVGTPEGLVAAQALLGERDG